MNRRASELGFRQNLCNGYRSIECLAEAALGSVAAGEPTVRPLASLWRLAGSDHNHDIRANNFDNYGYGQPPRPPTSPPQLAWPDDSRDIRADSSGNCVSEQNRLPELEVRAAKHRRSVEGIQAVEGASELSPILQCHSHNLADPAGSKPLFFQICGKLDFRSWLHSDLSRPILVTRQLHRDCVFTRQKL